MTNFKTSGWTTVPTGVSETDIDLEKLFDQCKHMPGGNMGDPQVPGSPSYYNTKEIWKLQFKMLSIMEKYTGLKLYPTYNYYRNYLKDAVLKHHTDRPSCEISATVCIGIQGTPWDIHITSYEGKTTGLTQKPGDVLIYRGCDLDHWRENMFEGVIQTQAFLHYVNQYGKNEDWVLDIKRKQ